MLSYRELPRYQKAIQKLMSRPAHVQAVVNPDSVEAAFADEEARKQLLLTQLGQRQRESQQRIKQAEFTTALEAQGLGLKQQQYDFANQQQKTANILAGLGVPLTAGAAYLDYRQKQKMANYLRSLM